MATDSNLSLIYCRFHFHSPLTDAALQLNNNYVLPDAFKINSPLPGERVSSEEITKRKDPREEKTGFLPIEIPTRENTAPEKRKWSQVNTHKLLQQFASGNDSSSSDDEIRELCSKKSGRIVLSSSPPGKVTVLSKHSAFSSIVRPTTYTSEGHLRKKHRLVFAEDEAFASRETVSRPSLNFEKMQQVGSASVFVQTSRFYRFASKSLNFEDQDCFIPV